MSKLFVSVAVRSCFVRSKANFEIAVVAATVAVAVVVVVVVAAAAAAAAGSAGLSSS